ncbi:carbohydrate-binding family 9-like protein [Daejeonella sp.]|uniref:carbohydrate-binding family 9-like protein n=1 Tax=Daejeonella sp. TaxID=2805397 RepID=UPI0030BDAD23
MNLINYLLLIILPVFYAAGIVTNPKIKAAPMNVNEFPVYKVERLKKKLKINADWNKAQWKKIEPIRITNYMGKVSAFQPEVQSKMMYNDTHVYVIFQVKDRLVRSIVTEYNGNVSSDSCVEFFFSPDEKFPLKYFNLEVNAGGTPLMFYIEKPMTELKKLTKDELKEIHIAHSLPETVDPEIAGPVTWTIEYSIPLSLLSKYSNLTRPAKGVNWKANFYKTGSRTSNPNYITWAVVDFPRPNFHLPQFFGTIQFQ